MRTEHDLPGAKSIPDKAYYGVQSARAMENFHISGVPLSQYQYCDPHNHVNCAQSTQVMLQPGPKR